MYTDELKNIITESKLDGIWTIFEFLKDRGYNDEDCLGIAITHLGEDKVFDNVTNMCLELYNAETPNVYEFNGNLDFGMSRNTNTDGRILAKIILKVGLIDNKNNHLHSYYEYLKTIQTQNLDKTIYDENYKNVNKFIYITEISKTLISYLSYLSVKYLNNDILYKKN